MWCVSHIVDIEGNVHASGWGQLLLDLFHYVECCFQSQIDREEERSTWWMSKCWRTVLLRLKEAQNHNGQIGTHLGAQPGQPSILGVHISAMVDAMEGKTSLFSVIASFS